MVISTKMHRTIIIKRDYLHYVPKYNRFEKRHKNVPVHCSPCFSVKEGDIITAGQCRFVIKKKNFVFYTNFIIDFFFFNKLDLYLKL